MLTLMKVLLSIILVLAVIYAGALAFGAWHWDRATQTLVARLRAARQPAPPRFVHLRPLGGLLLPVQHYVRARVARRPADDRHYARRDADSRYDSVSSAANPGLSHASQFSACFRIGTATEDKHFARSHGGRSHYQPRVSLADSAYRTRRDNVAKPLAGYTALVGGLSGIGSIRIVRPSSSSIATRISIRAKGAPGQTWIPAP